MFRVDPIPDADALITKSLFLAIFHSVADHPVAAAQQAYELALAKFANTQPAAKSKCVVRGYGDSPNARKLGQQREQWRPALRMDMHDVISRPAEKKKIADKTQPRSKDHRLRKG